MLYSKNAHGSEVYPVDKATGIFLYLTNDDGIEITAKDANGLDYYASKKIILSDGTENYIEYPPVDTSKNVYKPLYITNTKIVMKNGKIEGRFEIPKYPNNLTTGNPIYEKTLFGDEKYFIDPSLGTEFFGINNKTSDEVYAKDYTGKDCFTDTQVYAKNTITQAEIYPRDQDGNEYYKVENYMEIPARDAQNNNGIKYARLISGEEVYPRIFKGDDDE